MVFGTGDWIKVDNPSGGEEAYVNPNAPSVSEPISSAASLTPEEVDSTGWDAIEESLSAPEAAGVEKVGMDLENGLVDVVDSKGSTTYLLAAVGDTGEMSVVDENGNVSTSEVRSMPLSHHVAITEAVLGNTELRTDAREMSIGFGESYVDQYEEIMSSGSYETLGGDVRFDFDNVEGVSEYKNNDKAEKFIDQLEDIAEFFRDYEQDYNLTDQVVDPDIPVRPERKSNNNGLGSGYKFRARGSDKNSNIVIREKDTDGSRVDLDVLAFSNHHGLANTY